MSFRSRRSFLFRTVLNANVSMDKNTEQHLFLLLGHVDLDYIFFPQSIFFKAFYEFCIQQTGGSVCSSALSILALAR